MSGVTLAHKYSAETYDQALTNLVERWKRNDDGELVKYDEAAIGMDKSTVSTTLKFFGEIGLLESPKAGQYKVPEEVVNFKTKMGDVQKKAKHEIKDRIADYPLYSEAIFYVGVDEFNLEELVTEVAGSSEVAASKQEVDDVERSIRILAELGLLEIDEEGGVSVPTDLNESTNANESFSDNSQQNPEAGETETEAEEEPESKQVALTNPQADTADNGQPEVRGQTSSQALAQPGLMVDMEISINVTEMETKEVEDKLEIINNIFNKDGE